MTALSTSADGKLRPAVRWLVLLILYHGVDGQGRGKLVTPGSLIAGVIINKQVNALFQYIPRNMHTVFALLCFVVVIHWLIFPYPSGLLHWHCGNLTIAPVPAKQPWWIWINTSCELIMNDCLDTTKQSTTKPCAYFLGYTVLDSVTKPHYHFQQSWLFHRVSDKNILRTYVRIPSELKIWTEIFIY